MSTTSPAILDAARLDRRITFQSMTSTTDEYGQIIVVWVDFGEAWAEVQPLQGVERINAEQLTASFDTRFTIRWRPDLEPSKMPGSMRVRHDDKTYDITSVSEIGRREGFLIEGHWIDSPSAAARNRARAIGVA